MYNSAIKHLFDVKRGVTMSIKIYSKGGKCKVLRVSSLWEVAKIALRFKRWEYITDKKSNKRRCDV